MYTYIAKTRKMNPPKNDNALTKERSELQCTVCTCNLDNILVMSSATWSCADPEGGQGVRTSPLKNHKNIRFSSNTGPNPLENRSYEASIQCWAIIGLRAKRHLMAVCWRADDGPLIVVLGSSLPSSLKKKRKKRCQSWTHSDKTFWIRACW